MGWLSNGPIPNTPTPSLLQNGNTKKEPFSNFAERFQFGEILVLKNVVKGVVRAIPTDPSAMITPHQLISSAMRSGDNND